MKTKVTKKELKENYKNIVSIGYCSAYYLLKVQEPIHYYTNNFGWRFDVYALDDNTILTTGYEFLKENKNQTKINDLVRYYNNKAKEIFLKNYDKTTELIAYYDNLEEFIFELKELIK